MSTAKAFRLAVVEADGTRPIRATRRNLLAVLLRLQLALEAPVVAQYGPKGELLGSVRRLPPPGYTEEEFSALPSPRDMLASLLGVARLMEAPVVAKYARNGDPVSVQPVVETTRLPRELRGPRDIGGELHKGRMTDFVPAPYQPRSPSPEVADKAVTMAMFGAVVDMLAPEVARAQRGIAEQSYRIDEQDYRLDEIEELLAEERDVGVSRRLAESEVRNAQLELRIVKLETRLGEVTARAERLAKELETATDQLLSVTARAEGLAERITRLANNVVEDIQFDMKGRILAATVKSGGEARVQQFRLDYPLWQGVYRTGQAYEKSDIVTYAGSQFIALQACAPEDKPESSRRWVMCVKRGRDGRQA